MTIITDIFYNLITGVIVFFIAAPIVFVMLVIRDLFYPIERRWRPWTRLKNAVRRTFEWVVDGILSLLP